MNERDDFSFGSEEFLLSVKKYEEQIRNNKPLFFDLNTFEELIEYYELQGKTARAMEAVEYAIGIYPFSASMLIKKAELLFQYRKYDEALRDINFAIANVAANAGLYAARADIYFGLNDFEHALSDAQTAQSEERHTYSHMK